MSVNNGDKFGVSDELQMECTVNVNGVREILG